MTQDEMMAENDRLYWAWYSLNERLEANPDDYDLLAQQEAVCEAMIEIDDKITAIRNNKFAEILHEIVFRR